MCYMKGDSQQVPAFPASRQAPPLRLYRSLQRPLSVSLALQQVLRTWPASLLQKERGKEAKHESVNILKKEQEVCPMWGEQQSSYSGVWSSFGNFGVSKSCGLWHLHNSHHLLMKRYTSLLGNVFTCYLLLFYLEIFYALDIVIVKFMSIWLGLVVPEYLVNILGMTVGVSN